MFVNVSCGIEVGNVVTLDFTTVIKEGEYVKYGDIFVVGSEVVEFRFEFFIFLCSCW